MVAVPKRAEIKDLILNWYSKLPFKKLAKLYPILCISAAQVYRQKKAMAELGEETPGSITLFSETK